MFEARLKNWKEKEKYTVETEKNLREYEKTLKKPKPSVK